MQNILTDKKCINQSIAKYSTIDKKTTKKRRIFIALAGVFIGVVNGLFGAGGGMLTVPALTYILGFDEKSAHASAIAIILPLCLVSSIVYSVGANYDFAVISPTIIGVTIGGILGAQLLKKLSNDALTFMFYGIMLFAGLKMIFQ